MSTALKLHINGRERALDVDAPLPTLADVLQALELRGDRVAVELNGDLAPRAHWPELQVRTGDKLEIVHFVGGGAWR